MPRAPSFTSPITTSVTFAYPVPPWNNWKPTENEWTGSGATTSTTQARSTRHVTPADCGLCPHRQVGAPSKLDDRPESAPEHAFGVERHAIRAHILDAGVVHDFFIDLVPLFA
jgi:hypothetical protein